MDGEGSKELVLVRVRGNKLGVVSDGPRRASSRGAAMAAAAAAASAASEAGEPAVSAIHG